MSEIEELKQEISKLKERNKKVDANKAWETSMSRKLLLVIITYILAALTLITIKNDSPWTNALIPTLGFYLSTLTLPFVKNIWKKYLYRK